MNEKKVFFTNITIDNTKPQTTFKELSLSDNRSKAEITSNEAIRPLSGWDISNNSTLFTKDFSNSIFYALPITDFAENSSEVLVDIKTATNILLEYGTYDDYSRQTLVSSGKITAPNTISSNSICKAESIFIRFAGDIGSNLLQGKAYLHTYWGNHTYGSCTYSENRYYHGYNPTSPSEWWDVGSANCIRYNKNIFSQFGGRGVNMANRSASVYNPIPTDIAKQYLFGISGIQFRLKDSSSLSIVYQCYVKDVGWLKTSSDGEENLYQHDKPISSFRINLVPKTEKQYLIDFWNRDIGTNNID